MKFSKMKMSTVIMLSMSLLVTAAQAEEKEEPTCESVEALARQIMSNRQRGVLLTDMIKVAKEFDSKPMKNLIIIAYKKPKFTSATHQTNATNEFANKAYISCLEYKDKG